MSSNKEVEIEAIMILEVLGKPKEHLAEALGELIDKIGNEKGVFLISKKIHEPKLVKDQKDLYTTYAEVEIKVEKSILLASLMFKYMPSNIDIISPENITLTNNDFADILSEVTRRLHSYDEIARVIQMEKQMLEKKVKELEGSKDEKK